jgi:uncharacterized sulfatase
MSGISKILLYLSLLLYLGLTGCQTEFPSPGKPNILLILIDDLGWSDLGCYGHPVHYTPHIDRLADQGMQFTDAYAAAPICSPTRAAMLTGKSPARLHFEFVTKPDKSLPPEGTKLKQPDFPRDLSLTETTLAEIMDSTYLTGFFGKWHLTQENDRYLGWGDTLGPLQQGFKHGSENRGSHPYDFTDEEKHTFGDYPDGIFPEDELVNQAISFLEYNQDNSFFLYYSMYHVHTPVQTRCRWLYNKYENLLPEGTDPGRIHYAAFTETMDHYVGMLLDALTALEMLENTLVILTSDNGGHPGYTDNAPLRGNKWNLYEGGIRVPLIIRWTGNIEEGVKTNHPAYTIDIFPTLANLTNVHECSTKLGGMDLSPVIFSELNDAESKKYMDRSLYWHFPFYHPPVHYEGTSPCSAIRRGKYKLIYYYEEDRCELFDLDADLSEKADLSKDLTGIRDRMRTDLMNHLNIEDARFPEGIN